MSQSYVARADLGYMVMIALNFCFTFSTSQVLRFQAHFPIPASLRWPLDSFSLLAQVGLELSLSHTDLEFGAILLLKTSKNWDYRCESLSSLTFVCKLQQPWLEPCLNSKFLICHNPRYMVDFRVNLFSGRQIIGLLQFLIYLCPRRYH